MTSTLEQSADPSTCLADTQARLYQLQQRGQQLQRELNAAVEQADERAIVDALHHFYALGPELLAHQLKTLRLEITSLEAQNIELDRVAAQAGVDAVNAQRELARMRSGMGDPVWATRTDTGRRLDELQFKANSGDSTRQQADAQKERNRQTIKERNRQIQGLIAARMQALFPGGL